MTKKTLEFVLNLLRRGTITWPVRTECLNRNRRKRPVGNKFLWERQCDGCKEWFLLKDKKLEVDHIEPVRGFNGDFNEFISRMYCGPENLQALCIQCHLEKTSHQNATLRYERKNKRMEGL